MTFNISKLGLVRKNQLINANIYVILKSIDHCTLQADILFLSDQWFFQAGRHATKGEKPLRATFCFSNDHQNQR